MKLENSFVNEIKKTGNGDGGRKYMFSFMYELREISAVLANRYEFENCIKNYGRAKVALCVAATIEETPSRYELSQIEWAEAVMKLWKNKNDRSILSAQINIHPAILADNSFHLRKLTVISP